MASAKNRGKGKSNWMQSAVKHPGAATRAAKREGISVSEWSHKHEHDSGTTGKRARLAITFAKYRRKG